MKLFAKAGDEYAATVKTGPLSVDGSSLRGDTREVSGWAVFFLILSAIALATGAFFGLLGLAGVGAAIVFAQWARHLQASRDHQELMDAVRDLRR